MCPGGTPLPDLRVREGSSHRQRCTSKDALGVRADRLSPLRRVPPPTPNLPALNVLKIEPPKERKRLWQPNSKGAQSWPPTRKPPGRENGLGQGEQDRVDGPAGCRLESRSNPSQMPWGACGGDMSVKHTRKRERSGREQPTRDSPGRRNRDSGGSGPRRTAEVYTRRRASHRSRNSRVRAWLGFGSTTLRREWGQRRQAGFRLRERIGFGNEINVSFSRELQKKTVQARMARSGNWETFGLAGQRGQRGRVQ